MTVTPETSPPEWDMCAEAIPGLMGTVYAWRPVPHVWRLSIDNTLFYCERCRRIVAAATPAEAGRQPSTGSGDPQ